MGKLFLTSCLLLHATSVLLMPAVSFDCNRQHQRPDVAVENVLDEARMDGRMIPFAPTTTPPRI